MSEVKVKSVKTRLRLSGLSHTRLLIITGTELFLLDINSATSAGAQESVSIIRAIPLSMVCVCVGGGGEGGGEAGRAGGGGRIKEAGRMNHLNKALHARGGVPPSLHDPPILPFSPPHPTLFTSPPFQYP